MVVVVIFAICRMRNAFCHEFTALLTGPAEPFSLLKPTHYITSSGALASLSITPSADLTGTAGVPVGPNSPLESSPYTGLFGGDGSGDSEEQEIVIWDRLPRHDHFDIEMPSKVICRPLYCMTRVGHGYPCLVHWSQSVKRKFLPHC